MMLALPTITEVTVNVTGLGPDAGLTVATEVFEDTAEIVPLYELSEAVNVPVLARPTIVKVLVLTLSGPSTVTLTTCEPPWSSVTVIVAVPGEIDVTVKVTGPGPGPDAGLTDATPGALLTALMRPVYAVSDALNGRFVVVAFKTIMLVLTMSGPTTVTLTFWVPP